VALNLADLAVAVGLVGGGCIVSYLIMRRALRRAFSEQQHATQRQLEEFASVLKALEARLAGHSEIPNLLPVAAPLIEIETEAPAVAGAVHPEEEVVTPEILAVIAAAAKAFLGMNVRILSAKLLQSPQGFVNPWSQQGRVFVQASHNLRSRS
jgi:hypothetical protein